MKKWIKGIVVNDKISPGMIGVQQIGTGYFFIIARNTNQRIVDPEKGIKKFEIEAKIAQEWEKKMRCKATRCTFYNTEYLHNCSNLSLSVELGDCPNYKDALPKEKIEHKSKVAPEPAPIGNGKIVFFELMRDIIKKTQMGKEKYDTYLKTNNGRNALVDAYQEAIDLCFYLKQKLMEEEE